LDRIDLNVFFDQLVPKDEISPQDNPYFATYEHPDNIELKVIDAEYILVLRGTANVISRTKKETLISKLDPFEILKVSDENEIVILPENSRAVVITRPPKKGFFARKSQKNTKSPKADAPVDNEKQSLLAEQIPKIRSVWEKAAGPISRTLMNDRMLFEATARIVYGFLPRPLNFVMSEAVFVEFCYANRGLIAIGTKERTEGTSEVPTESAS
jgi:hypothetical protein